MLDVRALILLAHGSRNPLANDEVVDLAARLEALKVAPRVVPAFLEQSPPDLEATARALIAAGVSEATVLPLFLNRGRHVTEHIPALVAATTDKTSLLITLAPHVGEANAWTEYVASRARAALD